MVNWKRQTPKFLDWEAQDEFEGVLVDKDIQSFPADDEGGEAHNVGKYSFVTENGDRYSCLGGKIMDDAMANIDVHSFVRIEAHGKQRTLKGQTVAIFEVFSADAPEWYTA